MPHRPLLLVLLVASACAASPRPDLAPLRDAAEAVERGSDEGRELALAGWRALFDEPDAAEAERLAERARQRSPRDPWGIFLRAELAHRRLDAAAEAETLLELVERAPDHPLAMVAAGRLAGLLGASPSLDERIATGIEAALASDEVEGELRVRLRGTLRTLRIASRSEERAKLVAESGLVTAGSVVGPFSAYHALEANRAFGPEGREPVAERYVGARGEAIALRPFSFPLGSISLRNESSDGDVHYVLAVAEVPASGRYALRLHTSAPTSAAVFLDGVEVVRRLSFGAPAPTLLARAIELAAGEHLLAIRVVRGRGGGDVLVSLAPLDGSASGVRFRAAMPGDRPGRAPKLVEDGELRFATDAGALASGLIGEAGVVGLYAAALDEARRNPAAARVLVERALERAPQAAPLLALDAELLGRDGSLTEAIAAARAGGRWEALLAVDPGNVRALVAWGDLLADAGRHEEATARFEAAREAGGGDAVTLAMARQALRRGFDAQALRLAREATGGARACEAWALVHELSRRIEAVAEVDRSAEMLRSCGRWQQLVTHLTDRGDLRGATDLAEGLLADAPQDAGAADRLVDLLVAADRLADGVAILERQEAFWPRDPWLPRRRAELLERLGDEAGARAARQRSLSLDGADLALRRMEAFASGGELLGDVRRDGLAIVRQHQQDQQGRRRPESPAVLVLDLAAVEVYEDGSQIELVHTITQVLDKRGIDQFGEVHLPPGAQVLHLRTIKPDGTILVPEEIEGKESISLPGLAEGDYVEVEYLAAHRARSPALPGWSASPFYFRTAGVPMVESVYLVRAAQEAGLELDVHNGMEGAPIEERDGWLHLTLRRTGVQELVPEPGAPSGREFLPWAQVGAGADESALFPFFADNLADSTRRTPEVARWARETAEPVRKRGNLAVVRALYDRAMEEIEGNERGFDAGAPQILARRRGNRLLLLAAALEELGIEWRFAAVRSFDQDPDPYRFPESGRWSNLVLVVRPKPGGEWIWLDPGTRWTPFGVLAPSLRDCTAWLLPRPGETAARRTRTPAGDEAPGGRQVDLRLVLDEDGALRAEGTERYLGFEGAVARDAFEGIDEARRRQVIESVLAGAFPGLALEELAMGPDGEGYRIDYSLRVPGAAHDLGDGRWALPLDVFRSELGRRYLTRARRETPLYVGPSGPSQIDLRLELPEGTELLGGAEAAREFGPFGDFKRDVAADGRQVSIRQTLRLKRGRVAPEQYPDFAAWLTAVDRGQAVELLLRR